MTDPRIEKLADVIVHYSAAIRCGDRVLIQGMTIAEPLIREIYSAVLNAGGHPLVLAQLPGLNSLFIRHASPAQLEFIHEPVKRAIETYDAGITVMGSENTKALTGADPEKIVLVSRAQKEILTKAMQRMATGAFRWVGTQFPTNANAQDAEMSLYEYEQLVYCACLPDMNDPIGYWQDFSSAQMRIVDWLKGKERIHVIAPDTDLRVRITDRPFLNCDGRRNMPDGEICTSPVEDSAEGHVHFSYPAIYQGREVTGVTLWFEEGKVVKATAEKGEDFLLKTLDTDDGSRYVGEFAIGTNKGLTRFTRSILFDEKIQGSFHLALGASLPETGGSNRSAIHWDMICDLRKDGEIWVDDVLFYKNGTFIAVNAP
jgi:aminopeptidase